MRIMKPKSELSILFIAITIMLIAFAGIGYYYLTSNQDTLMKVLQAHDDRLMRALRFLNITEADNIIR